MPDLSRKSLFLRKTLFLFLLLLSLAACRPEAVLPTAIPTAAAPVGEALITPSGLPPTRDLASPTSRATDTPPLPTSTPAATPTPVIGPVIDINEPVEGAVLRVGSETTVRGFAQVGADMSIAVGLSSATGYTLASAQADVDSTGWQTSLDVPEFVTGRGLLQAVILDAAGDEVARSALTVTLEANRETAESYMTLFRPEPDAVAVAGHNLFLDGYLWRAGGGNLQVAVFTDECNESVADVGFRLSTSSYWQGYVILPPDVSGPACAVAWVGTPGEESWRAAQVPITILDREDESAVGITIANPRPQGGVRAGESLLVNGVAYNVPGQTVRLNLSLADGQLVAEAEAQADRFGYWKTEIILPSDVEGEALLTASVGEDVEPVAEAQRALEIAPAR